jgi:glutamyl-tRNA synthetase
LIRPRSKRLTDFVEQAAPLLRDEVEYEHEAVAKHWSLPRTAEMLAAVARALGETSPFDERSVEATVRASAIERGTKAAVLIHAIRVALTGRAASPGLFEVIALLGRDRTLSRIDRAVAFLTVP